VQRSKVRGRNSAGFFLGSRTLTTNPTPRLLTRTRTCIFTITAVAKRTPTSTNIPTTTNTRTITNIKDPVNSPFSLSALAHVIHRGSREVRRDVLRLYAFLIALNVGAWALAFFAFAKHPILLGAALIAYTFGLRHAVDADHISAIDNVTRKLMQDGQRSVTVGFFFSLGHSTIVVVLSIAIAIAAGIVKRDLPNLQSAGGLIGTSVSAAFLLFIAAINVVVLADILRTFRNVRLGGTYHDKSVDQMLDRRGLIGRFFKPLLKIVDRGWKMYPIGILFGLGFDTATEVGLLGIAAVEASNGLPVYDILIFPLLFTAGMLLLDTTDGVLMLGAYGWAFVKPMRKLYYNLTITFVSVVVAIAIGGIEALSVLAGQLRLRGTGWDAISSLNAQFGTLGFLIVGIFIASWAISTIIYRIKRYDDIDVPIAPVAIEG
jgi:high-affinity nickel-transport protein